MSAGRWALTLSVALAGCASNPAPNRWLPRPAEAAQDVYGAWIELRLGRNTPRLAGEFLGVTAESVFVLRADSTVLVVAQGDATEARVAIYDDEASTLSAAAALGTLSTISNGVFLLFTAPIWIITGGLAASSQSRASLADLGPEETWADLARFARFPGGVPAELPRVLPTKPIRRR